MSLRHAFVALLFSSVCLTAQAQTLDCEIAFASDNLGTASGSSIQINYVDPAFGGNGGDITLTLLHAAEDPGEIIITPDDGSGAITLTGGEIGVGSTEITLTTATDNTPATNVDSVTYTISYAPDILRGGATHDGANCTVSVFWAPPSCSMSTTPEAPLVGDEYSFNINLTNVLVVDGVAAVFTTPLATSDIDGGTLKDNTLVASVSSGTLSASSFGPHTVELVGPGESNNSSCDFALATECPVNNTDCNAVPTDLQIAGSVTIPLSGDNVVSWDISYNGVTTNIPGSESSFELSNLSGSATDVTITANGFGLDGNPCTDQVSCTLDFAAPVCNNVQVSPPGSVDLGTVLTLSLDTTNAASVTIDGVPMNPSASSNSTYEVSWEADHTAVQDMTLTAVVTNPNGETTTCEFTVDINCLEPIDLTLAPIGQTGVSFLGTLECTYTVYVTGPDGSETAYDVIVDQATNDNYGIGNLNIVIEPDTTYSLAPGAGSGITTVPTLGEWGLSLLLLSLIATAVVMMRKQRIN